MCAYLFDVRNEKRSVNVEKQKKKKPVENLYSINIRYHVISVKPTDIHIAPKTVIVSSNVPSAPRATLRVRELQYPDCTFSSQLL